MGAGNINTFAPASALVSPFPSLKPLEKGSRVVVIGAGAFGGWTAFYLQQKGFKVTLVDAWGAGNARGSSGDETRVIRSTYGANELYFALNARALSLWKSFQSSVQRQLFHNSGVVWLCYQEKNPIVDDSIPFAEKYRMPYERIEKGELAKRFKQINCEDLSHAFLDPFGGYLMAREATQTVLSHFVKSGGVFRQAFVRPDISSRGMLAELTLSNGETIRDSTFIFACGSWLPRLFPDFLDKRIQPTRQEVYYLGTPPLLSTNFDELPVWIDLDGENFYYGIPGNSGRGFKIGVDRRGPAFDPTDDNRFTDPSVFEAAQRFIGHRFPALRNAPLVESRVCPYENSTTGNFIFDQHPEMKNVFVLGGGSGHGFKHGPALGELVAECFSGTRAVPDLFRISKQ